ncbi:GAF and ANTAR domain-containing protein [Arthrobacter sp. SX1312]|uniref:GAF and ANTAR domain-containing protein n=1 Tax=Arthrobacter sp. SX1312 TaxID=2058896 RepID=UPI000CE394B6|nr:GAF and ANTAR domain-containing protein [Arthrobacter sp. SX1312]
MVTTPPPSSPVPGVPGRTRGRLLTEQTAHDAVDGLAEVAFAVIRSADGAGVSLLDSGARRLSVGATSNGVLEVDDLQYELGEGPCLSAWATGAPVHILDTHRDLRWERWRAAAVRCGIRSCLSVPLPKGPGRLGAMKVYSDSPGAFSDADRKILQSLARSAAALLGHIQTSDLPQRLSDEHRTALAGRDAVGIARGILMERHAVDKETAMQQLIDLATRTGTTVRDQATAISGRDDAGGH